MSLGAFSVSLGVKDLAASRSFYTALGFEVFADPDRSAPLERAAFICIHLTRSNSLLSHVE